MLRPAVPADIEAVIAFWLVAGENTNRSDSLEAVTALVKRDPEALLLAVDGDAIVGSIIAGWDGWRCHIYRFAVDPSRRRAGIGRMLLEAAEHRFAALGGGRSDAMVLNDNELGLKVWAASGYVRQTDCARWVKPLA